LIAIINLIYGEIMASNIKITKTTQNVQPASSKESSIVVSRKEFDSLLEEFTRLKDYIDTNIIPTTDNFQGAVDNFNAHIFKRDQNTVGEIPAHLDTNNRELFARRVHRHEQVDIDFAHIHPFKDIINLETTLDKLERKLIVNSNSFVNVSTITGSDSKTCALDFTDTDIFNINLDKAECTLSITKIAQGASGFVYVQSDNENTLSYGGIELIAKEDIGLFRIEFQHNGVKINCINVMAVLA
jgi:hypothetical protein